MNIMYLVCGKYVINSNTPLENITRVLHNRLPSSYEQSSMTKNFDKSIYFKCDTEKGYNKLLKLYKSNHIYSKKYNLFSNNCMQTCIDALISCIDTNCELYQKLLFARKLTVPNLAYNYLAKKGVYYA